MRTRQRQTNIQVDLRPEGALEPADSREDERAAASYLGETISIDVETHAHAPRAETGLFTPVRFSPEGRDDIERQDAMRTTAETAAVPQSRPSGQAAQAPKCLIVEDAIELAEVLSATLQRMNIDTVCERSGARASARFEQLQPDIVLLDIGLPDMTGWKVLDNIKDNHRGNGMPLPVVIVITAYGDATNRLVGKLQGVHSYLVKPFTPDEVEQVIREALSSEGR